MLIHWTPASVKSFDGRWEAVAFGRGSYKLIDHAVETEQLFDSLHEAIAHAERINAHPKELRTSYRGEPADEPAHRQAASSEESEECP